MLNKALQENASPANNQVIKGTMGKTEQDCALGKGGPRERQRSKFFFWGYRHFCQKASRCDRRHRRGDRGDRDDRRHRSSLGYFERCALVPHNCKQNPTAR